ncbi:DUF5133 domain-containing protein [Streptomyces sp. NPDC005251]|uniref:DUF5133 domain-containing protein n=1 Tax=Streptomyces sp. NPDC005251 TaxID=3157166 RepID=UPI0033B92A51
MLMPLPVTLYQLVAEYESLLAEESLDGGTPPSQRLRDLAYTLCVSTGTREVTDALDTARSYLVKAAATVTNSPAATRLRAERRPASALSKPAAIGTTSTASFQCDAGEPSAGRRDGTLRPRHRPTAPHAAGAGKATGGEA